LSLRFVTYRHTLTVSDDEYVHLLHSCIKGM
jgi:hypothetical protein